MQLLGVTAALSVHRAFGVEAVGEGHELGPLLGRQHLAEVGDRATASFEAWSARAISSRRSRSSASRSISGFASSRAIDSRNPRCFSTTGPSWSISRSVMRFACCFCSSRRVHAAQHPLDRHPGVLLRRGRVLHHLRPERVAAVAAEAVAAKARGRGPRRHRRERGEPGQDPPPPARTAGAARTASCRPPFPDSCRPSSLLLVPRVRPAPSPENGGRSFPPFVGRMKKCEAGAMAFRNVYEDAARADAYSAWSSRAPTSWPTATCRPSASGTSTGRRAVDFGCGAGRSTRFLRGSASRSWVSTSRRTWSAGLARSTRAGDYRRVEPARLSGLTEGPLDLVLSAFTFDNIPQGEKAAPLRGLADLLAPGGRLVNLVSRPEIYTHEWASFSTQDFPQNRRRGAATW